MVYETLLRRRLIKFGSFEVDLPAGELRKAGKRLKLTGQPFQILSILLEHAGEVVTREELQNRLWPDTFVDVDHNLNTAVNKIREVLGDSAESPRFVETLPRRGYRFIAPMEDSGVFGTAVRHGGARLVEPHPDRLTFDDGLQFGATWSPDSRFIAYSSDRGGKFDIWVQQVSGGDPVQITKGPGDKWQPDWSPDGKYIAYRSEEAMVGIHHPGVGRCWFGKKDCLLWIPSSLVS
jgi:DNA-binding winged helix-turn-helix (wHTH) protein